MKRPNLTTTALFAAIALSSSAFAQGAPKVSGTVKKIDESAGKITLSHGAITNLEMDAMTMVFRAQEPTMLKEVKAGDKVEFTADRVNGQITVTSITKSK